MKNQENFEKVTDVRKTGERKQNWLLKCCVCPVIPQIDR